MSQPDGVSNVSKRPPPTPQAIEEARQYCSQLYHAWTERPPTDSPLRRSWDLLFMQACKALGKVLKNYKFKSLPPFIIGCIWEFNNHVYDRTPFVDVEAIRDANDSSHPALNPASARYLRYQPAIDGPVVIQPRTDVRDVWWEADASGMTNTDAGVPTSTVIPDATTAAEQTPQPLPANPTGARSEPSILEVSGQRPPSPHRRERSRTPSQAARSAEPRSQPHRQVKRKASRSPLQEDDVERSVTAGPEAISKLNEAESIPETLSFPLGWGCEGCRKIGAACEVDTFAGTVCKQCRKIKFWRASHRLDENPDPIFVPPEYATNSASPPDWWLARTPSGRDRKRPRTSEPVAKPATASSRGRSHLRNAPSAPSESERPSPLPTTAVSRQDPVSPHLPPRPSPADSSADSGNPIPAADPAWTHPPARIIPPSSARRLRPRVPPIVPRGAEEAPADASGPDSRQASPATLSRRTSASGVMRAPRLNGSWRDLPTLARVPTPLPEPEAESSDSPPTRYLPDSWRPQASISNPERLAIPGSTSARPRTPPAIVFQPGVNTIQLAEEAQRRIASIRDLQVSLARAAAEAEGLAQSSRLRQLAAQTDVRDPDAVPEALELLSTQQKQLEADNRRGAEVLGRVSQSLASVCALFELLPPVPMNDRALLEMLELVHQLRELYGTIQTAFQSNQESLRPVQAELLRVREEQQLIIDRLDQVPNDVSTAVHPLLRRLYDRVNQPRPTALPNISADGQVSLHTRNPVPPETPVHELTSLEPAVDLWTEVDALRARIELLEGAPSSRTDNGAAGEDGAPGDASVCAVRSEDDMRSMVVELRRRVTRLEGLHGSRVAVREYLEGLGLDSDHLRRLASMTLT
ncbi:hypothetical protein C8Q76DRAFT_804020 [Earliella scabrosa]|nr:hypothetical protein C8Q76DRAFT_804020 [Earliella scabrosa]